MVIGLWLARERQGVVRKYPMMHVALIALTVVFMAQFWFRIAELMDGDRERVRGDAAMAVLWMMAALGAFAALLEAS